MSVATAASLPSFVNWAVKSSRDSRWQSQHSEWAVVRWGIWPSACHSCWVHRRLAGLVFTELYSHPYKLLNWNYTAGLRLSCGCSGEGAGSGGLHHSWCPLSFWPGPVFPGRWVKVCLTWLLSALYASWSLTTQGDHFHLAMGKNRVLERISLQLQLTTRPSIITALPEQTLFIRAAKSVCSKAFIQGM